MRVNQVVDNTYCKSGWVLILRRMCHVFIIFGLTIPSAGYKQDFFHTKKGCAPFFILVPNTGNMNL